MICFTWKTLEQDKYINTSSRPCGSYHKNILVLLAEYGSNKNILILLADHIEVITKNILMLLADHMEVIIKHILILLASAGFTCKLNNL